MPYVKIETVRDRFANGTFDSTLWGDSQKWDGSGFPDAITASPLVVSNAYAGSSGLTTLNDDYDLTSSGLSIELLYCNGDADALFLLAKDSNDWMAFRVTPDSGIFSASGDPTKPAAQWANVGYVPVTSRYADPEFEIR